MWTRKGDSIPRLYDWYDDLAERVREGVADDFTRLYTLCQLPENQAGATAPWQLRFGQVAFIVQMPHLHLATEPRASREARLAPRKRRSSPSAPNMRRSGLAPMRRPVPLHAPAFAAGRSALRLPKGGAGSACELLGRRRAHRRRAASPPARAQDRDSHRAQRALRRGLPGIPRAYVGPLRPAGSSPCCRATSLSSASMKRAAKPRILPRTHFGNPVLRSKAKRVPKSMLAAPEFQELRRDMIHTMQRVQGVGLGGAPGGSTAAACGHADTPDQEPARRRYARR